MANKEGCPLLEQVGTPLWDRNIPTECLACLAAAEKAKEVQVRVTEDNWDVYTEWLEIYDTPEGGTTTEEGVMAPDYSARRLLVLETWPDIGSDPDMPELIYAEEKEFNCTN